MTTRRRPEVICGHCRHEQAGAGPVLCPRCGYIMKDKPRGQVLGAHVTDTLKAEDESNGD